MFCPAYKNFGSAKLLSRILYYGEDSHPSQDEKDLAAFTLGKVTMAEGIYSSMSHLENAKMVVCNLSAL